MIRLAAMTISMAAVLTHATASHAADTDLMDAPEVTIFTDGEAGGLYLRTDIGYAVGRDSGTPDYRSAASGAVGFDAARFSRPLAGSVGIGYDLSDIVRADVTADYFEGRFAGRSDIAAPCAGEPAGTGCETAHSGDYRALGLMANVYVDLGTVAGFTPYLGAGAGATYVDWTDVSARDACGAGAAACIGAAGPETTYDGRDSWRFTYQLTAGASYDLTERVKLDVSYRYSDIGGGAFYKGSGVVAEDDGLERHEIRAGLRVSLY